MYDDSGRPRAALSVFVCVVGESLCVCVCVHIHEKERLGFCSSFFFFLHKYFACLQ